MLRLTLRETLAVPIETDGLIPNRLVNMAAIEVARLPVQHGNAQAALGDFFAVEGSANDGEMLFEGDCSRVKHIGAGMTAGRLTIQGDAGMHLGAAMSGGEIHVHGHAGDWAGAEMRGGLIHVRGNAGHLAGAAYRGSRIGMRGGAILIGGNAGDEVGSTMRRGLVAVGGTVDDFVGASMIAGTVLVFGPAGARAGAGMKRGTLAFLGPLPPLLPTFRYACTYRPEFMGLYLRQLRTWGFSVKEPHIRGSYRRYHGDLVELGKGEVLHWQAP